MAEASFQEIMTEHRSERLNTFKKTVIVLLTLLGAYLIYELGEIIVVLFAAIILASAIRPLVEIIAGWGIHRGLASLVVLVMIVGLGAGLLVIALPPLVGLLIELFSSGMLMRSIHRLSAQLALFGWDQLNIGVPTLMLPAQLQKLINAAGETAEQQAWPIAKGTIVTIGNFILAFVMCYYWLMARDQMFNQLVKLMPLSKRKLFANIWSDIESQLGAYIRGQTLLGLMMGVAAYAGLLVLDVPYALALALVAGVTEAIPIIGPFIGAIPAVIVGLTVSPSTGVLVAAWYLLIQQVESHVLVPRVMSKHVGLNPLVVIIAIIAGATLNGVVGAFLAIPLAGALEVVAQHLLIEPALTTPDMVQLETKLLTAEETEETA